MANQEKLRREVEKQVRRMKNAEKDKATLFAQTVYLGTLGFLFIIPVVGGAYLGLWLDNQSEAYSALWTVSLTVAGIFIGLLNVYFFVRE